jgi:molecular chaperone DnaJ
VQIETPVHLNREQIELIERLNESLSGGGSRHSPQAEGWLDGVKQFFDKLGL